MAVWTELPSPRSEGGDPHSLWVRPIDGTRQPRLVTRVTAWRLSVGNGFVAYVPASDSQIHAVSFTGHDVALPGNHDDSAFPAAEGNRLAYVTATDSNVLGMPAKPHVTIL